MHPHMILNEKELTSLKVVPGKLTLIITTNQARLLLLMTSILSVLANTRVGGFLEHIIVVINGADPRTGDCTLQDQKQKFVEELRSMSWDDGESSRDMPLTLIRVWSRVGHAESLEMAIPWIHTEYYGTMHDDVVITKLDCFETIKELFQSGAVIATPLPFIFVNYPEIEHGKFGFPHLNTVFCCCHTATMTGLRARWTGYSVPLEHQPFDWEEFNRYNTNHFPPITEPEKIAKISQDIGAWMLYYLEQAGIVPVEIPSNLFFHVLAASWRNKDHVSSILAKNEKVFTGFEQSLKDTPYESLYQKYKMIES